ncbi:MAG: SDR family oxidoreductase [Planctomycetaceae bacterium]|nr:SDR family oxidoreductase [Planctomycetaceae bacterium]
MTDNFADQWGLITGASSGIGKEFARQLAARGMHLVLTARRSELLDELAEELHTRHGTKTEIVVGDLAEIGFARQLYDTIDAKGLQIQLLVNNAGAGHVGTIQDADVDRMVQLVELDVRSLTELTYLYLHEMLKRRKGAIINVASVTAFQPVAYMPVYAASKAFVLHFSEALWAETRDQGVTVTALCPGTTQTDFFDSAGVGGWLKKHRSQTVDQVVKAALRGLRKKRQYYVSGWLNYLLSLAVRLAPRRFVVIESMKYFRPTTPAAETND